MSTSVKLPQWGMSMSEGTVTEWMVAEGDTVEADQELVEVEAAKVTKTVAAPVAGTVGPLLAAEGETIEVNVVLVEIYANDEALTGAVPTGDGPALPTGEAAETKPTEAAPATEATIAPGNDPDIPSGVSSDDGDRVPRDPTAARAASGRVTHVVPLARKLAKEKGVDLQSVTGTGTNGRIIVKDVQVAIEQTGRPTTAEPAAPAAPVTSAGSSEVQPLSSMRRTIGDRMTASLRESAQLTLTSTADLTDFAQLRASVGAGAHKPSYIDSVIRACALTLRDHPGVNAYLDGDSIVTAKSVNVGMAVALDDGLVVPVIRDADRIGLAELGDKVRELAQAARSGGLTPDDYEGGTFSVTSLGGQGIDAFTPILNPPESAILGVGRSREIPIRFGDGIAWRQEMTLSLTIDHRVVDGYPGALFLQNVVQRLENPRELV